MLNEEEREIINKAIHLPLVRKVLEQDLTKVKNAQFKFEGPYTFLIEQAIIKVSQDLRDVKADMHKRGIKIFEQEKKKTEGSSTIIRYQIINRGYEEDLHLFSYMLKENVLFYLKMYLASAK